MIFPSKVTWNITRVCNLSCTYCCGTIDEPELSTDQKIKTIDVLVRNELVDIGISGGEPFALPEFVRLLRHMDNNGMCIDINTNGTLITESLISDIRRMEGIKGMDVSIDGPETIHDRFRGGGTYRKVIENLGKLRDGGIPFHIIWTVTRDNLKSLGEMAALCHRIGAQSLTVNDMIPMGRAVGHNDLVLSPREISELCRRAYELHKEYKPSGLTVSTTYPFSFLVEPSSLVPLMREERADWTRKFNCGMGSERLFVSPSGSITPCNYLHERIGHILEDDIGALWNSERLSMYRTCAASPGGKCGICEYRDICGGCRAAAFHRTGLLDGEDMRCFHNPAKRVPPLP